MSEDYVCSLLTKNHIETCADLLILCCVSFFFRAFAAADIIHKNTE